MTQADLARLADVARGVAALTLGALGVAAYVVCVRPVVRAVGRRRRATAEQ